MEVKSGNGENNFQHEIPALTRNANKRNYQVFPKHEQTAKLPKFKEFKQRKKKGCQ